MDTLATSMNFVSQETHNFLDTNLTIQTGPVERLYQAMRYSSLTKGKCVRPFLVYACGKLFDVPDALLIRVGAAIEAIHTYSLIHDDLPAMDDDDLRRGQPSCHIQFDEATAILAGNALYTAAIEWLSSNTFKVEDTTKIELIHTLSTATGAQGTIGGQMIDIIGESTSLALDEIHKLHKLKTGALIATSCEMGAILGQATQLQRNALREFGYSLGLAFQIIDDILDVEGVTEILGKPAGSDENANKSTFVKLMGLANSKTQAQKLTQQAIHTLAIFNTKADPLRELAHMMLKRQS